MMGQSITIDDQGWIKEATGIYYPSHTFGPFAPGRPKWIVIHATASGPGSTAQGIARDWANTPPTASNAVSVHCLIGKDASDGLVQGLSCLNAAWGNSGASDSPRKSYLPPVPNNLNFFTLSVEHVKYDMQANSDPLTDYQKTTSFALVDAWCTRYGIPREVTSIGDPSQGGIISHADCDGKYREFCPGDYPWQELSDYLNGGVSMDNHFIGTHANDTRVQLWRSFSQGIGRPAPREGTGLFNDWVNALNIGENRGSPYGPEYPLTLGNGTVVMAQSFPAGIWAWINATAIKL